MPRKQPKTLGGRPYVTYTTEQLEKAVEAVKQGLSLRKASEKFGVPRATVNRHIRGKNTGKYGRPQVFSEQNEATLVQCICLAGDWGFPITQHDIRLKTEDTFVFPAVEDLQTVTLDQVITEIKPVQISRGRYVFPKQVREYKCS